MKVVKKITFILITAILAAGLTGCTTFDNFKAAFIDKPEDNELTIQIGVLEPVTGSDSQAAVEEIRGMQLANKVHPSVNGRMISLVFSDGKSNIDATETAAQTLVAKKPLVILGSYGSAYSMAAGPYIMESKIPAISVTNTNPLVTRNNPYYFRVCYVDSNQGDLLARYLLEEKKVKEAGVLLPESDDVAMAKATAFTDRIKAETENDDSIAYYETYRTGQEDFTKELKLLKKSKVKEVILPGEYKDSAKIINQAAAMNLDVEFLGDTTWGEKDFLKLLDNNVDRKLVSFVQFFASEGQVEAEAITDERENFLKAYEEEYGSDSEPSVNMALGYDAYFVAVDAIDKAPDNATNETIRNILSDPKYSFEGATGTIKFNSYGDPIKTAYISNWSGDKIQAAATILMHK